MTSDTILADVVGAHGIQSSRRFGAVSRWDRQLVMRTKARLLSGETRWEASERHTPKADPGSGGPTRRGISGSLSRSVGARRQQPL